VQSSRHLSSCPVIIVIVIVTLRHPSSPFVKSFLEVEHSSDKARCPSHLKDHPSDSKVRFRFTSTFVETDLSQLLAARRAFQIPKPNPLTPFFPTNTTSYCRGKKKKKERNGSGNG